jgi:hypothetical protein
LWLCGSTRKDITRRTEISPAGEHHVEKKTTWEECDEAKGLGGDVRIQAAKFSTVRNLAQETQLGPQSIPASFLLISGLIQL